MWFSELAAIPEPGRKELVGFVDATMSFLRFVLEAPELRFLWDDNPPLRDQAFETFSEDVFRAASELRQQIPKIPDDRIRMHGLAGRPMRFKLAVADTIGRRWQQVRSQFTVREWLKRIIDAIDAILDSLIDAAGGAGGLIKEFKDALGALVPTA